MPRVVCETPFLGRGCGEDRENALEAPRWVGCSWESQSVTSHGEAALLLALLTQTRESWAGVAKELATLGSVAAVVESRPELQPSLFDDFNPLEEATNRCREELEKLADRDIRCLPLTDDDYPNALREMKAPPPFVFIRGTLDHRDHAGVAVIGSRKVPQASLDLAHTWAADLAAAGVVVISGLAAGVDRAAHLGALSARARTTAVIGTGILQAYPAENRELQERIAAEGLVVSQFLPTAPPSKTSFPMRNAVMAAWSRATLVIDAGDRSGAALQARLAFEQGKTLLLHIQLQAETWARDFVENGKAAFVASPQEVTDALCR